MATRAALVTEQHSPGPCSGHRSSATVPRLPLPHPHLCPPPPSPISAIRNSFAPFLRFPASLFTPNSELSTPNLPPRFPLHSELRTPNSELTSPFPSSLRTPNSELRTNLPVSLFLCPAGWQLWPESAPYPIPATDSSPPLSVFTRIYPGLYPASIPEKKNFFSMDNGGWTAENDRILLEVLTRPG